MSKPNDLNMKIEWYFNGILINNDNEKYIVVKESMSDLFSKVSTLKINNLSLEDVGVYECHVFANKLKKIEVFWLVLDEEGDGGGEPWPLV